ncbi:hypothetical protein [Spirosoma fluviale]|nr:hypothetical protein [Spirosoma fluviale]
MVGKKLAELAINKEGSALYRARLDDLTFGNGSIIRKGQSTRIT